MIFSKPLPIENYLPPRLTEGQECYVSYYVRNPETGKMKRFRIKLNRIHNVKERRKVARQLICAISERLANGWNPCVEKLAPRAGKSVGQAFDLFLKLKGREMEENSMRSYRSFIRTIRQWMTASGVDEDMSAALFDRKLAMQFMDDLEEMDGISARTFNNYLCFCRTLFNWMKEKGYVPENPFEDIRKKPKKLTKKVRRLLTEKEVHDLFTWLDKNNQEYLAMCLLCYCCFIRPKEIALLRCRDIDLEKQIVRISSEIAKNDNDSVRTIPDSMMPFMMRLDLSSPDSYLFGNHPQYLFTPGKEQLCSRKIAKYWSNHVRQAVGLPEDVQFYSLKDTGITNMVGAGIPITFVQQQADHSSIAMTAIYVGRQEEKANEELKGAEIIR